MDVLESHVPEIIHEQLRASRYYVHSSNSILIQCDEHRNQTSNKEETYRRLNEEIRRLYNEKVPGVASDEQRKRVEDL
jgi:peptidyl-tRNA hydrolase ICT1